MTSVAAPATGYEPVRLVIPRSVGRRSAPRDLIVWAAVELFTEVGYHGTSVRDIGERARTSSTSLYSYFGGKEELLSAIMVASLAEVLESTREALAGAPHDRPDLQLAALVRAWIDFHTRRQALAAVGATELRSLGRGLRGPVLALRDEQESVFRDVVERGVASGVFRTPHPREATTAVIQMGRDVSGWYTPSGTQSATALADQYVVLALDLVRCAGAPGTHEQGDG